MRVLALLTLGFVGPLLAACATGRPSLPEADVDITVVGDFEDVRPVRVLVAPVDAEASLQAPVEEIRRSFYRKLIDLRYAPFRLDLDAAAIPEDPARGTLAVRIGGWDRSRIADSGCILVSGEATLERGGRALWKVAFGRLAVRATRRDQVLSGAAKDRLAAAALGPKVLAELPPKLD